VSDRERGEKSSANKRPESVAAEERLWQHCSPRRLHVQNTQAQAQLGSVAVTCSLMTDSPACFLLCFTYRLCRAPDGLAYNCSVCHNATTNTQFWGFVNAVSQNRAVDMCSQTCTCVITIRSLMIKPHPSQRTDNRVLCCAVVCHAVLCCGVLCGLQLINLQSLVTGQDSRLKDLRVMVRRLHTLSERASTC
jgi:hypothetical protein